MALALATAPVATSDLSPDDLRAIEEELLKDAEQPPAAARRPAASPPSGRGAANPDITLTLDAAAAAYSAKESLLTGAHDPSRTGFNWQQLEMGVEAPVDPFFTFKSFIVFAPFGVEVEEAYATTLELPWNLQARAGQFLTRFGRINATHPHSWDFVDQTLVVGKMLGSEGNRGLGAELSWLFPLPWYVEAIGSFTDAAGDATARSFYGATDLGVASPLDLQATGALKQFFPLSRDWSLAWGLSVANGPNASGRANRTDLYGSDLYLKYRPLDPGAEHGLSVTLEALNRRRQQPGAVLVDTGGYASAVWRFDRHWESGLRADIVEGLPGDPRDPDWSQPRYRGAASLTFRPTEFSRLRLQGNADFPTWQSPIYGAVLALEWTVGAHGSHAF
jgi:hypothetical protein